MRSNFYVDDLLKSYGSVSEAVALIKQLKCLLASEGFHLTKFLLNEPDFLSSVSEGEMAVLSLDLNLHGLSTQKTLVVYWDAANDKIRVRVNITEKPLTRRGMLSMISQIYCCVVLAYV